MAKRKRRAAKPDDGCSTAFLFSIFVIWIHADNISSFTEAGAQVTGPFVLEGFIIKYLANLGVAGFYLCSGYLFYRGFTMEKLSGKWKSRVKTLVLPYIVWNLIYYILHYVVLQIPKLAGMFADRSISLSWRSVLDAVIWYRYNPVFWYLQFLIIFVFLCPVIYVLLRNRYVGVVVLAGYAGTLVLYTLLTYIQYTVKYHRAKKSVKEYYSQLTRLEKIYNREEKKFAGREMSGGYRK